MHSSLIRFTHSLIHSAHTRVHRSVRPFKGFLVRWFEWLNATWPHPEHTLINSARDANGLSPIVPCLFSHLPARADLVIVEAGSIVPGNQPPVAELLARQLLGMRSKPAILFVTVRTWCKFGTGGGSFYRPSYGITELRHQKLLYPWGAFVTPRGSRTHRVDDTPSLGYHWEPPAATLALPWSI